MYGSMTTIVLIMLWLYLCMYVILLGGEVNALLEKYLDNHKTSDKNNKVNLVLNLENRIRI